MGSPVLTSLAFQRWLRVLQLLGLTLIVAALASAADRAAAGETFPLDKYPGLGRSPAAALRDDTIAAWEAFRREQLIASCMERSAFKYVPAVAFPAEPLATVAKDLRVVPSRSGSTSPGEQNETYAAGLSPIELELYYRALFGESAADVTAMRQTGRIPDGRADFVSGGCVGHARAAVPSVWTLKQALENEFEQLRRDIAASPEFAAAGVAYANCAQRTAGIDARSPRDLDALASGDASRSTVIAAVVKDCSSVWAAGYRTAEVAALKEFERRNAGALLAAQQHYRDAMTVISADGAFLAYLAQYALGSVR